MTLTKKKHDIRKLWDCIRFNSERRDSESKQKLAFLLISTNKDSGVQVFKPAFHEKAVIVL